MHGASSSYIVSMNAKEQASADGGARKGLHFLSPREVEILGHAANGLADKQIARQMGLQLSTVRTYWERAREKLGASNRTHAVSMLVALGIINVSLGHLKAAHDGATAIGTANVIRPQNGKAH
jgi:DNA-binding NarL/FixJ family response regulator